MCESGAFRQRKRFFQLRDKAQKEHLSFVPRSIVEVAGAMSRVEMYAKERRP